MTNNDYGAAGSVADKDPRIISNLIADMTANNPAAVAAAAANPGSQSVMSPGLDGVFGTIDDRPVFFIPNVSPDAGLSAPFNPWMTFFGQFFDHGLDLVTKGGNGTVFIPLQADDPLIRGADNILGTADDLPPALRFMAVTRDSIRTGFEREHHLAVCRPEPDLYVASFAPGVPAFLRVQRRGRSGGHRPPDHQP
ncbi:hypothetical protein LP417_13250 [Polaromonas sp. P1-6]|nr:hypothetical protein LP417_13250 [Polaromonas sp. P1-6]